jgi:hypothetical protein
MVRVLLSLPVPLTAMVPLALFRFLVRPQLLTCLVPLPIGRDISPSHRLRQPPANVP